MSDGKALLCELFPAKLSLDGTPAFATLCSKQPPHTHYSAAPPAHTSAKSALDDIQRRLAAHAAVLEARIRAFPKSAELKTASKLHAVRAALCNVKREAEAALARAESVSPQAARVTSLAAQRLRLVHLRDALLDEQQWRAKLGTLAGAIDQRDVEGAQRALRELACLESTGRGACDNRRSLAVAALRRRLADVIRSAP